jgi:hypothetical protein
MRAWTTFCVIAGSILIVGAAATAVPPALLRSDAPALEVTTSILPVTQDEYQLLGRTRATPGTYRCSVQVHDEPGSQRVWGTKDIVLGAGQSGQESADFGQLLLEFRASVGKSLDRAETRVTIYRDGKVINRQTSAVWLQRTGTVQRLR